MKISKTFFIGFAFVFSCTFSFSQNNNSWLTYVISKDKGPMVITVDTKYNYAKPSYKHLLFVGTTTRHCQKNGYPDFFGLAKYDSFTDSISVKIKELTKNRLVGFVTYQCSSFDVYYVKDTTGVKNKLKHFLDYNYALSKNYLEFKLDKKWVYYKTNLLPKDITDDFVLNNEILIDFVKQGDALNDKRKVSHLFGFRSERNRKIVETKMKKLEFTIDSVYLDKKEQFKYKLEISSQDNLQTSHISEVTLFMAKLGLIHNGFYFGWFANARKEP